MEGYAGTPCLAVEPLSMVTRIGLRCKVASNWISDSKCDQTRTNDN